MGSTERFSYDILGDAVNLASRIEGQTKEYGVLIILGENTVEKYKKEQENIKKLK
jgi:adenylate cyclase